MADKELRGVVGFLHRVVEPCADEVTDGELLGRFITHCDDGAFALLVRRHGPMVLAVCRRLLRRSHDIEDAFQATFLVLARRAYSIDRPHQLGSWLYGVAHRTSLKFRSMIARHYAREHQLNDTDFVAPPDPVWECLSSFLDEEISRLPQKYRSAFVLCYLQGKTTAEAGKELQCARGTILSRLAWARDRLRNRLKSRGVAISAAALTSALANGAYPSPSRALVEATRSSVLGFTTNTPTVAGAAIPATLATGVLRSMMLFKYKMTAMMVAGVMLALVPAAFSLGISNQPGSEVTAAQVGGADTPQTEEKQIESGSPKGWKVVTSRPESFSAGLDRTVFHGGKASAYLALAETGEDDVVHMTQVIKADDYRGKRLCFTGWVKAQDVRVATFPWMRVDSKEAVLQCDDHSKRAPAKGNQEWKQFTIVLDVGKSAANLVLGFTLKGKGKVWVDDLKLEVVDEKVPLTNQLEAALRFGTGHIVELGLIRPTNLDFEEMVDGPENSAADWLSFSSRKGASIPTLEVVFEGSKGETKNFSAVADVMVISYLADKPWGYMKWLALDLADRNRTLLRFEPKLDGKVAKAELVLQFDPTVGEHPTPARPFEIAFHEIKEEWDEMAVTWDQQPSFVDKAALTVQIDPKAKEVRVDITALVKRLTEKDALRHGWVLKVAKPLKDENH
jgi:RNA polymerase sigma factor (sigma-70 family)